MRLYEYEAKKIAGAEGIPLPEGRVCFSPAQVRASAEELGCPVMVKAQVLTGGRGKAGGIKAAGTPQEAEESASFLFRTKIRERDVNAVLVEKKLEIAEEYYMGLVIDEVNKTDVFIFGTAGGMEVEEAARAGGFQKVLINPLTGLMSFQVKEAVDAAGVPSKLLNALTSLGTKLYSLYAKYDATVVEINPLAVTSDGKITAADIRMDIDDDAFGRQAENLKRFGIEPREDKGRAPTPLEMEAEHIDKIDHRGVAGRLVEFDGDIGLIIGGGGASLTVMDAIYRYGGKPANYCEIGGNPTVKKVQMLTETILKKPGIKKLAVITNVLSNTRVDLVARGVIKGLLARGINPSTFPIVFRVPGSWEDDGFKILRKYGIKYFDRTHTMDEAAKYVVEMKGE